MRALRAWRRPRRTGAVALVGVVVAGAAVAGVVLIRARTSPCAAAASSPAAAQAVAATPPGLTARVPAGFGVYTPGFPGSPAALDQVAAAAGRAPAIVMWYAHWGGPGRDLDTAAVRTVLARGAVPMITWMTDAPAGGDAAAYRDDRIASGADDAYIRGWASGLRTMPGTVLLRLDHEMNCSWSPWAAGVGGQTATDFVAMWRHVHAVFDAVGAGNVRWVWSPNVAPDGPDPLRALYPGDAAVDLIGLDGYNWGTSQPGKRWQSFDEVFGASLADVRRISGRPILLTEVGCAEAGGDKAAWVGDFLTRLPTLPGVVGFVWFDADKETDWRIDSSAGAAAAFRAGLARLAG